MTGWVHEDSRVRVEAIGPLGAYENNAYIVSSPVTGDAIVVDAAAEADRILAACRGLDVVEIVTTHGHHDHLQAVDRVSAELDVGWRLHPADVEISGRSPDGALTDGEEIVVGDVAVHVVHTPGHTPGSVCFVVEPVLLSGDTLFPGGPGATRWEYSSFGQIMDSIERKLFTLPGPTLVYPGHGRPTTVDDERPHADEWRARGW